MFPTKITENKPKSTFCMAKRDSSHFGILSCTNRFENHGNKSIESLMNPFETTRYTNNRDH